MLTTRRQRFYVAKFSPKSHEEGIQFKYLLKPFFKNNVQQRRGEKNAQHFQY